MSDNTIEIHGKTFEKMIPEVDIQRAIDNVAERLKADYANKNPLFVIVLNGAFVFGADVFRRVDYPAELSFVKLSSYQGTASTGIINEVLPIMEKVTDRHVVIIEDIVETGRTMHYLLDRVKEKNPASVEICALAFRQDKCLFPDMQVKYEAMTFPEAFVVGYGFDYDQAGRQLRDIYQLK